MKKIIAISFFVVLCVAMLFITACGSDNSSTPTTPTNEGEIANQAQTSQPATEPVTLNTPTFDKFTLKSNLDDMSCDCGVDCSEIVSTITLSGDTLIIETTGMIHPLWDNREFDCMGKQGKVIYDFVNNNDVKVSNIQVTDIRSCETDCKIVGKRLDICEGNGCLKQVTYSMDVSWNDYGKLANLDMNYDTWLAIVKIS